MAFYVLVDGAALLVAVFQGGGHLGAELGRPGAFPGHPLHTCECIQYRLSRRRATRSMVALGNPWRNAAAVPQDQQVGVMYFFRVP